MSERRLKNTYYQNDHLIFSRLEAGYIFADLQNNEYHFIDGPQVGVIDEVTRRVGLEKDRTVCLSWEDVADRDRRAAEELLSEKLLAIRNNKIHVRSKEVTWASKNIVMPWPRSQRSRRNVAVLFFRSIIFLFAFGVASILRWIDRPSVSVRVIRLFKSVTRTKNGISEDSIAQVYSDFCSIRRFFYTARNQCYFDSMVAAIFLSLLGYDPNWVFGVELTPFRAHCWVKVNENILTDQLANVVTFVPIFAV